MFTCVDSVQHQGQACSRVWIVFSTKDSTRDSYIYLCIDSLQGQEPYTFSKSQLRRLPTTNSAHKKGLMQRIQVTLKSEKHCAPHRDNAVGLLWSGCACLPTDCKIKKRVGSSSGTTIECKFLGLRKMPYDIPPDADRLELAYNAIRNVPCLPRLPRLFALDLSENDIETVAWPSLRNLPALEVLYLIGNRLQHVQMNTVLEYLPKLRYVDLTRNNLVSCSPFELGWPRVSSLIIRNNPSPCGCDLFNSYAHREYCSQKRAELEPLCLLCSVCFFVSGQKHKDIYCKQPDELKQPPPSNVSTECEKHAKQPTTRAKEATTEVASAMMITGESHTTSSEPIRDSANTLRVTLSRINHSPSEIDASRSKGEARLLQSTAKAVPATALVTPSPEKSKPQKNTPLIDGSHHNTELKKSPYTTYRSETSATQTGVSTSPPKLSSKKPAGQERASNILYISITMFSIAMALTFIVCLVRLHVYGRCKLPCRDRSENANPGAGSNSIPLNQMAQPDAINYENQDTYTEENLENEYATVDENYAEYEYCACPQTTDMARGARSSLYSRTPDIDSASNSAYGHNVVGNPSD
ncbi:hypothetical protein Bbelb_298560 [Branchiostoma belcheri]|nr:hypothetical protein Bbelb_298560 [Branchiostoma belcheri]